MSDPLVSVVIPTYRHRETVLAAIESARAQAVDKEIIVVNDGSPDDTADVLRPLANSGEIRYVEQPNAGQAAARNKGISLARGQFIALLDDDDLWPDGKLVWQVAALQREPAAVLAYGDYQRVSAELTPLDTPADRRPSGEVLADFLEGCWIASPGQTLIRSSTLEQVGGFDTSIWGADDWDLYIRLAKIGPFVFEPKVALKYRVHAANASGGTRPTPGAILRHVRGHFAVVKKHPLRNPLAAWRRRKNGAAYFLDNLLHSAWTARREGDRGSARAARRYALRLKPSLLLRPRFTKALLEGW